MPSKRHLLLCFDAFGTLFKPRMPIAQQYAEVARQCGLIGVAEHQLQDAFRAAFKSEAKAHPNYGRATGMGAEKWWANIIRKTFSPLLSDEQALPDELVPRLLHRFSSDEGYSMVPQLPYLLKVLKEPRSGRLFDKLVIGVITNSDDRVPKILSSFGLRVSPLRYGTEPDRVSAVVAPGTDYDIDFHCMSYDVGFEKPDRKIFEAAEDMLRVVLRGRFGASSTASDLTNWDKIYVGDDYDKDVVGALNSGWQAAFLEPGNESEPRHDIKKLTSLQPQLQPEGPSALFGHRLVSVPDLKTLVHHLVSET
ncbi:hypothetical protein VTK73DRAFT_570 [Phialemonium thermophilum]|uniref:Uncharacterized protein n=1 Tax=Phialemonium thermophilum TaxID=223376 RepID=A0ABR3XE45_9PEZI